MAFSISSASRWTTSLTAWPADPDVVDRQQLDPVVVLDLGQGGPDHVDQRHRLAPAAGRLGPREHDQVLGVAAHAGGQVVELEEVVEGVGVGLGALQVVDQLQLAVDQALAAPGQVEEHVADRLAQGGLLGGDLDGHPVDRVEGGRHLADLVVGLHRDRFGDDVEVARVLGVLQLVDQAGQPLVGDLVGAAGQRPQRPDDRADQPQREADRDPQHQGQQDRVQQGLAAGVGLDGLAGRRDVVGHGVLDIHGAGRSWPRCAGTIPWGRARRRCWRPR